MKYSVLIVDDHAVVRTGYKSYLALSEKIGRIFEADCGETACQVYQQQPADVVILDLSMPGIGGFECIRRLLNRDSKCKILVFSIHNEPVYATRAIKAGAKGYITKNSMPETLINAVCTIAQGQTYISPELAQKLAMTMATGQDEEKKISKLSPREFDIFCLLAKGLTSRDIAENLHLSYKTVCNHSTNIKDKLEVKNIAELALLANRQGLID